MPLIRQAPPFTVDLSDSPPSCLPTGHDTSNLRDITPLGARWRVYLNTGTGEVLDCAKFAGLAMPEMTPAPGLPGLDPGSMRTAEQG